MKKIIAMLFGLEFLRDGFYAGLFILVPFIAKDLHLSLTLSGSLQSFMYLVGLILSLPLVYLIEKISGMKLLTISLLTFALACFGLFFTTNYSILLICFFFAGIGFCIYGSLAHGMLAKSVNKQTRGKLVGNMMAVGDISKVIAASTFVFFVLHIGWRILSLLLGIIFFLLFIIYLFLHTNSHAQKHNAAHKTSWFFLLRHKEFLYVLIAGGLDMFANVPLYFLLPFLLFSKGLSPQNVGLITGTYFLGNTASRLIFGRLVDKHGSAKMFIISEVLMAIVLILLVQAHSFMFITIFAITLGLITEASDPATVTMTAHIADKFGHFEQVFNARATVNRITTLIAPFLLGFIGDRLTIAFSFYTISLVVILAVIPTLLLIRINPKA